MRRTRNQTEFWYCLYVNDRVPGDTAIAGETLSGVSLVGDDTENTDYIYDEYGNETGERILHYSKPICMLANISPASGITQTEQFGNLENYDKVIVTHETDCPIDENTVLFIDKEPEYSVMGTPMYDYTVRRVAKSLNHIAIAVSKVNVS